MYRTIFSILISAIFLPGLVVSTTVHAETIDEVLQSYTQNVYEVHSWTMQALFDLQILYTHPVEQDDRIEYENVFALPVEDTMYQQVKPLFCKTYASLDWKTTIQPDGMTGEQTIKNAYANFTTVNPGLAVEDVENIKSMKPLPNQTLNIEVSAVGSQEKSNTPRIFIPSLLGQWHHFFSMWYPMPEELGVPKDESKIVMTQGDDTLFVLMYTPTNLNKDLLEYVRYACKDSSLQESDLECTLMIAPDSFNCKSFDIKLKDGNAKQSVFTITSFSEALAGMTVHIPTKVLMMTAVKNESANGPAWSNEYYSRIQLKSFVKK